jgi:Co/Zn/Cd efflux system component
MPANRRHGARGQDGLTPPDRFVALATNVGSVLILVKYKDGDANIRSVWLCSRNDAIGNVALMLAAWRLEYGNWLAGHHSGGDPRLSVLELGQ